MSLLITSLPNITSLYVELLTLLPLHSFCISSSNSFSFFPFPFTLAPFYVLIYVSRLLPPKLQHYTTPLNLSSSLSCIISLFLLFPFFRFVYLPFLLLYSNLHTYQITPPTNPTSPFTGRGRGGGSWSPLT